MMKRLRYILILTFFIGVLLPVKSNEVFPQDPLSLEALVGYSVANHHYMNVRAFAEGLVDEEHGVHKLRALQQDSINRSVAKLHRAFDVIGAIVTGGSTIFHTVNTGTRIVNRLKEYIDLINMYKSMVIFRLKLPMAADTILYTNSVSLYKDILSTAKEIKASYAEMLAYGTNLRQMKTVDLIVTLNKINGLYDRLISVVDTHYMNLWSFMTIRLGFWNAAIMYQPRDVKEVCNDGFKRWRYSALEASKRVINGSMERYKPLGGSTSLAGYNNGKI